MPSMVITFFDRQDQNKIYSHAHRCKQTHTPLHTLSIHSIDYKIQEESNQITRCDKAENYKYIKQSSGV